LQAFAYTFTSQSGMREQEFYRYAVPGALAAVGCAVAFRAQATLPFKLAYAAAWPLLGSAAIAALQPGDREVATALQGQGLDAATLERVRAGNANALASLQEASKRGLR
jgi:hypothetical protein